MFEPVSEIVRSNPSPERTFAEYEEPHASSNAYVAVIVAFESESVPPDADSANDAVPSPRMSFLFVSHTCTPPTQRG